MQRNTLNHLLVFILLSNLPVVALEIITEPVAKLGLGGNISSQLSHDGNLVVTGGRKDIFLWDQQTMELLNTFHGHQNSIVSFAFSDDDRLLASASTDGTAKLWDLESGEVLLTVNHPGPLNQVVFSSDETLLISSDNASVYFTNIQENNTVSIIRETVDDLTSDNSFYLTSSENVLSIKGFEQEQVIFSFQNNGNILDAYFVDKDTKVLCLTSEGFINVIDTQSNEIITQFNVLPEDLESTESFINFVVSPDEKYCSISFSDNNFAYIWEIQTGTLLHTLENHIQPVQSVHFNTSLEEIMTFGRDLEISFWNIETGELTKTVIPHNGFDNVSWSPDGKTILTGGLNRYIQQWDAETFHPIRRYYGLKDDIGSVNYSPDNSLIAAGSYDDQCYIWDNTTGELVQTLVHDDDFNKITFSPDGKQILSSNENDTAILWDIATGNPVRIFEHPGAVLAVDYTNDGSLIVTAGGNNQVRLWDAITGELIYTFAEHTSPVFFVDFSPNSQLLATSEIDGLVIIKDTQTGAIKHFFDNIPETNQINADVTFSPDGQYLAWGVPGFEIHLIDLNTNEIVRIFEITEYEASWFYTRSLSFSPDGRYLLSGHQDGIPRIWETGLVSTVTDWSVY